MLTYINLTIENDPIHAGIAFKSIARTQSIGSVSSIEISRKVNGASGGYTILKKITVSSVGDLSFNLIDILALSGKSYDYNIDIKSSSGIIEFQVFSNIKCKFEGLFIGDYNHAYVAGSNFSTEFTKNKLSETVTTLASRYPYVISNSEVNYCSGTSSGLFLELTDDKRSFIPDTYHEYTNGILEFLMDNGEKILKTHDGLGWLVAITQNPHKIRTEFMGMNAIEFSWVEVGEYPKSGMFGG